MESPFGRWLERLADQAAADGPVTSIDVSDQIERARDALRAHRTQVDPDGFWFHVPTETVRAVYPLEDFELLDSRVAADEGAGDLFAGIDPG